MTEMFPNVFVFYEDLDVKGVTWKRGGLVSSKEATIRS
jgi:hypothetical protein